MEIVEVPSSRHPLAKEFLELPLRLYRGCPQWVPLFRLDLCRLLDRRHPFFEHSEAQFFVARRQGETQGRIALLENRRYNRQHNLRSAHFYLLDLEEDEETAAALLAHARQWSRHRGLELLIGPLGFGPAMGGGILVEGFSERSAMNMMGYNYPYYGRLLEAMGFSKFLDLSSARLDPSRFRLPDRVRRVAERVLERGSLRVLSFRRKASLRAIAVQIARVYNSSWDGHLESYPMSEAELKQAVHDLLLVADPALIKILACGQEVAGFLFAFPDCSAAIQRHGGRLHPAALLDLLLEMRRTRAIIFNGAGILPRYQKLGGNALLYQEMERTLGSRGYKSADLTQVAETTRLMLEDIRTLGADIYKVHRIYRAPDQ